MYDKLGGGDLEEVRKRVANKLVAYGGMQPETMEASTSEYLSYFVFTISVPSEPPSEFSVTARSSTAISAEWKHIDPAFIHGILLGYNVSVTNLESGEKKFQLYGISHSYSLVENLKRYTDYLIKVCGYTSKGCGVTAEDRIKTLEDGE